MGGCSTTFAGSVVVLASGLVGGTLSSFLSICILSLREGVGVLGSMGAAGVVAGGGGAGFVDSVFAGGSDDTVIP